MASSADHLAEAYGAADLDTVEGDGAMRHSSKCARKLEEGRVDSIALSTLIWNDDSRRSQCGRKAYLFSTGYRSEAGIWQSVPLCAPLQ